MGKSVAHQAQGRLFSRDPGVVCKVQTSLCATDLGYEFRWFSVDGQYTVLLSWGLLLIIELTELMLHVIQ